MICPETIDPAALLARFGQANRAAGAVVSFTGVVRGDGGVEEIGRASCRERVSSKV